MGFWVTALLWVGSVILGRILQPRAPKLASIDAKPEKFEGITAEEGRCIPVLWGTRQFKGSNMGWVGDLSNTPIIEGSSTIGHKYYMGAQYLICTGPVDEVIAIHFNEKQVGSAVGAGNSNIVFGLGAGPYETATIPAGSYGTGEALALAAENAMKAVINDKWKVTFGFIIVAGRNDEIAYSVTYDGITYKRKSTIAAGSYSPDALAEALEAAMNYSEIHGGGPISSQGSFNVEYDFIGHADKFTFAYAKHLDSSTYESWRIYGQGGDASFNYLKTIKSTIGFRMDQTQEAIGSPTILEANYTVFSDRFMFAFVGTDGKLKLTDAGFTAASLFGLSTAADVDLLAKTSDTDYAALEATFTPVADGIQVDIDDQDFFGTEGGVQGRLDLILGSFTQAESSYLSAQFGTTSPAYRGICYAVQHRTGSPTGMYVGNTNYPKPISFALRRCPNQLGLASEMHNIAGDANAACMLWELLTDPIWGLGMPEAQLEKETFLAAGETLYAEALGLSMILDTTTEASDVILEILRHVDGVLYIDHLSGLIAMRLARADYVVADLPLISPANAHACEIRQRSWEETRNVVRLRFVDRAQNYTERVLQLQDQANIEARGGEMSVEDIPMPGISNETAAATVAARSLKVLSALPRQITLRVNREGWSLRPGAPFRLTWPFWGITDMPCRVSTIGLGALTDGQIRVQAVQDVIGPPWTGFVTPTAPPDDPPEPVDLPEFTDLLGDQALFPDIPMPTG